jgi:hypothetical protein
MTIRLTQSYRDFVAEVIAALETAGVDYAIGGNFASAYHGTARATLDLDVTLAPADAADIRQLSLALADAGCFAFTDSVLDAALGDRPLRVFSPESGFRADLYISRQGDELAQQALARRQRVVWNAVGGNQTWLLSPEDTFIFYLKTFQDRIPSLALHDLAYLLIVRGEVLDCTYIRTWARRLGVLAYWELLERPCRAKYERAAEGERLLAARGATRGAERIPA